MLKTALAHNFLVFIDIIRLNNTLNTTILLYYCFKSNQFSLSTILFFMHLKPGNLAKFIFVALG